MFSFTSAHTDPKHCYKLYLIVLLLIPLNFVTPSEDIGISIFSLGFLFFALLSATFLLYSILYRPHLILIKNKILLFLALFLAISIIVIPWSIDIQNSISHIIRLGYHLSATIFISAYLTTYWKDSAIVLIPRAIVVTSSLVAATIITDYFSITSFGTLPGRIWEHPDRAAGIVAEPNFAAGLLAISLPFFVYFSSTNSRSRNSQIVHLLGMIMTISAIYFTGSRMGILLITVFTLGVVVIHRNKVMRLSYLLPILSISSIGMYGLTVFQPTTVQRFTRLLGYVQGGVREGSVRTRIDLLLGGIDMIKHNPVTGVGPGNFVNAIMNYPGFDSIKYSHNTYLDVASQTGIIGFVLFTLSLILILKALLSIDDDQLSPYYILSYLILLGYLFFLSNLFSTYLWFVFVPLSITIENKTAISED